MNTERIELIQAAYAKMEGEGSTISDAMYSTHGVLYNFTHIAKDLNEFDSTLNVTEDEVVHICCEVEGVDSCNECGIYWEVGSFEDGKCEFCVDDEHDEDDGLE